MNKVELVVPVGSYEHLKPAILAGADSVYVGFSKYSARAYAENFNLKALEKAALYCHDHNVKLYLALNTLIKESELLELIDLLNTLISNIKIDAFIIQDFALLRILKDIGSSIPIHISTQMNIHNSLSAVFLKTFGIKRIILAREMTFKEVSDLIKNNIVDIEVFVHGSQCYSYSGQCYFSSMVGDRSGNRGTCPQPCRLKYRVSKGNNDNFKEEEYLISKTDLLLIDKLPKLIRLGVKALKIEGRMKTPEYVTIVTSIYKKYIDAYYNNIEYLVETQDLQKIKQVFSRKLTTGYFFEKFPEDIITNKRSGSTGNLFGRISDVKTLKNKKIMIVDSAMNLSKGDILEVWTKKGNEKILVNNFLKEKNKNKKTKKTKYSIETKRNIFFSSGDRVFKFLDKDLEHEIKKILSKKDIVPKKQDIIKKSFLNDKKIILKNNIDNIKKDIVYGDFIKKEQLYKAISELKTGTSISIIVNKIKDIKDILAKFSLEKNLSDRSGQIKLNLIFDPFSTKIDSFENINKSLKEFNNISNSNKSEKIIFYLSTPSIAYDDSVQKINKAIEKLLENNFFNFYITNYAFLDFLNNYKTSKNNLINIIFAYNLNITNSFTLFELVEKTSKKFCVKEIILSPELSAREANRLVIDFYTKIISTDNVNHIPLMAFYAYGYFPIMTARVKYDFGDQFFLKDRKDFIFMAKNDYLGNTIIYNSKKHNLLFEANRLIEELVLSVLIDSRLLKIDEIIFVLNAFVKVMKINATFISNYSDETKIRQAQKQMSSLIDRISSSEYLRDFTKGHILKEII